MHARLSAIYLSYEPLVRSRVRRCGIHDADVDDVVQEVFCVLLRRLRGLDCHTGLQGWLLNVTVFVCRNHRRALARRRRWLESRAGSDFDHCVSGPEVCAPWSRAVRDLLERLDARQRRVLLLTAFDHCTAREIAESLGVSPNTVASRLRAARRQGRAAFELCASAASPRAGR
jgi:RNA polymerase sigma-70 factor (ECF subfamily)